MAAAYDMMQRSSAAVSGSLESTIYNGQTLTLHSYISSLLVPQITWPSLEG